jgi:hypothetical protein
MCTGYGEGGVYGPVGEVARFVGFGCNTHIEVFEFAEVVEGIEYVAVGSIGVS